MDDRRLLNCSAWTRWRTSGQGAWGWDLNDMYRLPAPGEPPAMFGLHAKHFEGLPQRVQQMAFSCSSHADPGCTC